jgi:hypothetical protein
MGFNRFLLSLPLGGWVKADFFDILETSKGVITVMTTGESRGNQRGNQGNKKQINLGFSNYRAL